MVSAAETLSLIQPGSLDVRRKTGQWRYTSTVTSALCSDGEDDVGSHM